MKRVIVASKNPVKIEVATRAFAAVFADETFEIAGVSSVSGVPDQPMGDETRSGALNRLRFVMKSEPDADYWIGQEGGLMRDGKSLVSRAWIAVADTSKTIAESSTASFHLPPAITRYIEEGMELGHAADRFFESVNSKQGKGTIGHLTDGIINRAEYYLPAAIIAISELKHREWFR